MTMRWYIVHAYSNFENKVAESIREQARQRHLEHLFDEILVPKEKVTEVRRGRKVDSERKFFPGYVLVKMELTDQAFHLIKNTPKVTGFLGSGLKPVPISDAEAERHRPNRRQLLGNGRRRNGNRDDRPRIDGLNHFESRKVQHVAHVERHHLVGFVDDVQQQQFFFFRLGD